MSVHSRRLAWRKPAAVCLLIVAVPLLAQSQQAPAVNRTGGSPSDPELPARIVRLDAVVTDKLGRPIRDLKAADFQVVEAGVAQNVYAVEPARAERVVALLLDDFHVAPGSDTESVRQAALRFVDDQLRPSDLLAVHRPLDPISKIHFSRDRDVARQAIQAFNGRKGDFTALTEFEQKYIGRSPEAVRAARAQIVSAGLRGLVTSIGELGAGRSAIVLVTEGFARDAPSERSRRIPDLQGLARAASRYNVAIYSLDPRTPQGPGVMPDVADGEWAGLETLAAETGGETAIGSSQLDLALQRVARDLDAYYLLTYTSSHEADGRFYEVQVRTKVASAQVKARTGYWAPLRAELLGAADLRPSPPPRMLKRSILIDIWIGLTIDPDGAQQVLFTWQPAAPRNRPRPGSAPSIVSLRVTTKEGAVLYEGEIRPPRAPLGPVRDEVARFAADPGRVQFDLEIIAADGNVLDKAAHDIDVPDIGKADPFILPPQVLRCSSAREFRELSANPVAAPVPLREFRRTDRLLVRVPTHSPSGAPISLSARVVNRLGQVLREIPALQPSAGIATQFDLPLGWLAAGDYTLELTASTSAGKAREVVRFRVTG